MALLKPRPLLMHALLARRYSTLGNAVSSVFSSWADLFDRKTDIERLDLELANPQLDLAKRKEIVKKFCDKPQVANNVDVLNEVVDLIQKHRIDVITPINRLVSLYINKGNKEPASAQLQKAANNRLTFDSETWKHSLKLCLDLQQHQAAFDVLTKMQKSGIRVSITHYNDVLRAAFAQKDWKMMDSIVQEISKRHVVLNSLTYSIMMMKAAEEDNPSRVNDLYQAAKSRQLDIPEDVMRTALKALAKSKKSAKACKEMMRDCDNRGMTYDPEFINFMLRQSRDNLLAAMRTWNTYFGDLSKPLQPSKVKPDGHSYACLLLSCTYVNPSFTARRWDYLYSFCASQQLSTALIVYELKALNVIFKKDEPIKTENLESYKEFYIEHMCKYAIENAYAAYRAFESRSKEFSSDAIEHTTMSMLYFLICQDLTVEATKFFHEKVVPLSTYAILKGKSFLVKASARTGSYAGVMTAIEISKQLNLGWELRDYLYLSEFHLKMRQLSDVVAVLQKIVSMPDFDKNLRLFRVIKLRIQRDYPELLEPLQTLLR